MLCAPGMNANETGALSGRLERAEAELLEAHAGLDGSPAAWTRLERAKAAYREAEADAVVALGPREALVLVEGQLLWRPFRPPPARPRRRRAAPVPSGPRRAQA